MPQPPAQLVWFKRDLRVHDHAPLWEAAQRGPTLPLYIVEPSRLQAADFDSAHWTFIQASLIELREELARLGQPLVVRIGDAVSVLAGLHQQRAIAHLWAHAESGAAASRERDQRVRAWAAAHAIPFDELPHNGVIRGLTGRAGWAEAWQAFMRRPLVPTPEALTPVEVMPGRIPDHTQLRLPRDRRTPAQTGGGRAGQTWLVSFLDERSGHYAMALSQLATAAADSSRLSPYLSYGNLSLRQVVQAVRQRRRTVARQTNDPAWVKGLQLFESRLYGRSHAMQLLESEPACETASLVRALDGLRVEHAGSNFLAAWQQGATGFPLVDACMRCLAATGWLNYRQRALLASLAAFDLWLPWREPAQHLARLFLDYEPGIHYPQIQWLWGTAGATMPAIIDPTAEARRLDPNGDFIRRWLPELAGVPLTYVHAPWLMPTAHQENAGCVIGRDYPAPLVEHAAAAQAARQRLSQALRQPEAIRQAQAILEQHGSRQPPRRQQTAHGSAPPIQLAFEWGDD